MKPVDYIVAVWGEHYTGLFLEFCLPSLLSPNNLPLAQGRAPSVYADGDRLVIVTQPEDTALIEAHPSIAKAREHIEVSIRPVTIDTQDKFGQRYNIQLHCHKQAIAAAHKEGRLASMLVADVFYADGYCRAVRKWADEGKKLVLGIGLRGALESLLPELEEHKRDGVISLTPRDVVKLGMAHLHPLHSASIWGAPHFTRMPYTLLFPVFGQGYLVHSFCLHPYLLEPNDSMLGYRSNVDHDLPKFYEDKDTYVVTDSDEAMYCEFAPLAHFWPAANSFPASPDIIARWSTVQLCTQHWDNLQHGVFWHTDDIDPRRWDEAVDWSDMVVYDINRAAGR